MNARSFIETEKLFALRHDSVFTIERAGEDTGGGGFACKAVLNRDDMRLIDKVIYSGMKSIGTDNFHTTDSILLTSYKL